MGNPLYQSSTKTTTVPSPYQKLIEWDVNNNPLYIGVADSGVATNDDGWLIKKITYDGSLNPSAIRSVNNGIWDSRNTYTFS